MADPNAQVVQGSAIGTALPALLNAPGGGPIGSAAAPLPSAILNPVQTLSDNHAFPYWASKPDGTVGSMLVHSDLWNGSGFDFQRNNRSQVLLNNSAQTTTFTLGGLINCNGRGLNLFVNITSISGAGATLVVKVQVLDPSSSTFVDLPGAATAALTTTGLRMLQIYPGIAAVANQSVNLPLGRAYQIVGTITGTTPSINVGIGATELL